MRIRRTASMVLALVLSFAAACVPDPGPGTPSDPSQNQTLTVTYDGPRGICEDEVVKVGARVRPCQGLANGTVSVIVNSKVLDPSCFDFFAYYPITAVVGTASQNGGPAVALVQTDSTPGTPVFDTGFDVDDGPVTIKITKLSVDTANLTCGWFGLA